MTKIIHHYSPLLAVAAVLLATATGIFFSYRVTRAEFESPIVNTAYFETGDFRDIWSYYVGSRVLTNISPNISTSYMVTDDFMAYAVGASKKYSDIGVMYQLRNGAWEQLTPHPFTVTSSFSLPGSYALPLLNAVVGQKDVSTGEALIWAGGGEEIKDVNNNLIGTKAFIKFSFNLYHNRPTLPPYGISYNLKNTRVELDGLPLPEVKETEVYAMDAFQNYAGTAYVGGNNGLFLDHKSSPRCISGSCVNATPAVACTADHQCPDKWRVIDTSGVFADTEEDITDIKVVTNNEAYITTVDFPDGVKPYKNRADHECESRTSRIYRINGPVNEPGSWKNIYEKDGVCFYSLSADTLNTVPTNDGPLLNKIWVATDKGIYTFTELLDKGETSETLSPILVPIFDSTDQPVPVYGITSVPIRGGAADPVTHQSLLVNGDFESWNYFNPSLTDSGILPSHWYETDPPYGLNNDAEVCGRNTKDIMISVPSWGGYAIKVAPDIYYSTASAADCLTKLTSPQTNASASAYANVDLTAIESQKIRISGKYKVDLTADDGSYSQGGVLVQCAGAKMEAGIVPTKTSSVDCSYSDFSQVWTKKRLEENGNTSGEQNFSFVVSRQDLQFLTPLLGGTSNPRGTAQSTILQIRCYATYGVSVICDDLIIEAVDEPAVDRVFTYEVTVVGSEGYISRFDDGVNNVTANYLRVESDSREGVSDLTAVHGVSPQHIYAAGDNSTIIQRHSGNVYGFIWAGTASPTDDSGGVAGLGWLSTNCIDLNDSNGKSYCARARLSYGLSVEPSTIGEVLPVDENGDEASVMIGRAWMGKNYAAGQPNDDQETIDLGTCQGAARNSDITDDDPYRMSGLCVSGRCDNNTAKTCTYNLDCYYSCDINARTCVADLNRACVRDYDCYGRCGKDNGFVCLYDADCQVGNLADVPSEINLGDSTSGTQLNRAPLSSGLICGEPNSSLNACASGGWLTFNPAEFGVTPPEDYGCGSYAGACLIDGTRLSGWGRFTALAEEYRGWVSLRGDNETPVTINLDLNDDGTDDGALFGCQNCTVSGNPPKASCSFCTGPANQSCAPVDNSCKNFCDGDLDRPCVVSNSECSCEPIGFCAASAGDNFQDCTDDEDCDEGNGDCVLGAACAADGADCQQYGVDLDTLTGEFYGYSWSSDYGWLDWRRIQKGTRRYIQTKLGDIYSGGDIGDITTASPPAGACNATYVISAVRTITNFCSSYETAADITYDTVRSYVSDIPFADRSNLFENALGRLDLIGLETLDAAGKNKYGSPGIIWDDEEIGDNLAGLPYLGGQVFIVGAPDSGQTYTISQDIKIKFGEFDPEDGLESRVAPGNGIIIVNGNLRINNNITYNTRSDELEDIRLAPMLMVIVKGDLIIDNKVTDLAGNYYVLGDDEDGSGNICTGQPDFDEDIVDPCEADRDTPNANPLTVKGIMIGKKFFFARRFAGTIEEPQPSETIVNDGRLQLNPMPGTTDFANSFPSLLNTGP